MSLFSYKAMNILALLILNLTAVVIGLSKFILSQIHAIFVHMMEME